MPMSRQLTTAFHPIPCRHSVIERGGAVAFFDLFANPPTTDDTGLAVVQDGLDRGIEPALVERAARLLQGYELMYWDSIADATGV